MVKYLTYHSVVNKVQILTLLAAWCELLSQNKKTSVQKILQTDAKCFKTLPNIFTHSLWTETLQILGNLVALYCFISTKNRQFWTSPGNIRLDFRFFTYYCASPES